MAWQSYVDEHLMCDVGEGEDNHLTAAAIIGHDGTVRAQTTNFPQLKDEEMKNIMKEFEEPGYIEEAHTGLDLGGVKYVIIQGEPGAVIRGKKKGGGGMITIKKTGETVVFGLYKKPQCNMVVEKFGDYLLQQAKVFEPSNCNGWFCVCNFNRKMNHKIAYNNNNTKTVSISR